MDSRNNNHLEDLSSKLKAFSWSQETKSLKDFYQATLAQVNYEKSHFNSEIAEASNSRSFERAQQTEVQSSVHRQPAEAVTKPLGGDSSANQIKSATKPREESLADQIFNLDQHLPSNSDMTLGEYIIQQSKKAAAAAPLANLSSLGLEEIALVSAEKRTNIDEYIKQVAEGKFVSNASAAQEQLSEDKLADNAELELKASSELDYQPFEVIDRVHSWETEILGREDKTHHAYLFDKTRSYCNTKMKIVSNESFRPLIISQYKS